MGLYRRGKTYWLRIQYNGKRIQQSLETDSMRVAERRYSKIHMNIVEGRYFEGLKAKNTTFSELVDKYMKKYQKQRDTYTVKKLLPVFGHMNLSEISTERVSDYRDERLKKVKPATVYQELALMRHMFNVAKREWEWVKDNPVSRLSFSVGNSNARGRWLEMEEEERLLKAVSPDGVKKTILFALNTGMRRREILDLKWKDVDLKRQIVTVQRSKNGEKRSIPMSNHVLTILTMLKKEKVITISGKVFPVTADSLRFAFEAAVSKAGVENFRFHDCRHTFATRLVQQGVDLYKVKELLGHKSIQMTMRYAHHCPESLRSGIKILDKWYNTATSAGN